MRENKEQAGEKKEKERKKWKKQKQYEGSRWVAVALLVGTVLLSLVFYLKGAMGEKKEGSKAVEMSEGGFLKEREIEKPTWTFEK